MGNKELSSYAFSPRVGDFYQASGAIPLLPAGIVELVAIERTDKGTIHVHLRQEGRDIPLPIDYLLRNGVDAPLFQRLGPDQKEPRGLADIVVPGDKVKTSIDGEDPIWMTYIGATPAALGDVQEHSFAVRHKNRRDYETLGVRSSQVVAGTLRYTSPERGILPMSTEEHTRVMRLRGDYSAILATYNDSISWLGGKGDGSVRFESKALYIPDKKILVVRDPADPTMISGSTKEMYGVVSGNDAKKIFDKLIAKPTGFATMSLGTKGIQTVDILVGQSVVDWTKAIQEVRNPSFEVESLLRTSSPLQELLSAEGFSSVAIRL